MQILQESRHEWARQGRELEYATLTREAQDAEPFRSLIDSRAARFLKPGKMPQKIAVFCSEAGQSEPETPGQFVRCIFESLALLYCVTLEELEQLTGRTIRWLHIVGGGSQSALLNQFAASATGRQVVAGPAEATAIGSVMLQAIALGHVGSLAALRHVVRDSSALQTFGRLLPRLRGLPTNASLSSNVTLHEIRRSFLYDSVDTPESILRSHV